MGVVYRATDSKLKREVAIKVLPEAFAADADRLARFEREAQVLAQLQHPNIASIYGLEESSGVRALVMELVEGEDLAERLKRGAAPPRRGPRRRPADRRGARGRAREGNRPPRPQARERQAHAGRKGQGPRLRPRQGDGPDRSGVRGRASRTRHARELADDDDRAGRARGSSSAPRPTWRPSRRRAARSTGAPTSGRSASSFTRCSRGGACSRARRVSRRARRGAQGGAGLLPACRPRRRARYASSSGAASRKKPRERLQAIGDARLVLEEALAGKVDEPAAPAPGPPLPRARPSWQLALGLIGAAAVGALAAAVLLGRGAAPGTSAPRTLSELPNPEGMEIAFRPCRPTAPCWR